MTDSLAYTYDGFGNRTKEEDYNGTKVLTHRIIYTWRDTLPVLVLIKEKLRSDQRFALSAKQGCLTADISLQDRGTVAIYDLTGRLMCRMAVDHSGIVPLQGVIGRGSYVAVYTSGTKKQVMNFTIFN
jgi:hypothetical protein